MDKKTLKSTITRKRDFSETEHKQIILEKQITWQKIIQEFQNGLI